MVEDNEEYDRYLFIIMCEFDKTNRALHHQSQLIPKNLLQCHRTYFDRACQRIELEPGTALSSIPEHQARKGAKATSIKITTIGVMFVYARPTANGMIIH